MGNMAHVNQVYTPKLMALTQMKHCLTFQELLANSVMWEIEMV